MKKRNLKSLEINKRVISSFNSQEIKGGIFSWFWCKKKECPPPPPDPTENTQCVETICHI